MSLLVAGFSPCATAMSNQPPLKTVEHVDLKRYMGDWHVFSHMPYSLEKGKVGTIDRYTMRKDGKIDNAFLFRKKSLDAPLKQWKALAWVHDTRTNAEWRVQFIWPFRVPYLVIDLDKNYEWAVVGHPKRKLGWVLTRKTSLDEATYQAILKRMAAQGYDIGKMEKVPQRAQ